MTPEDQKYYDDYAELFAAPGWRQLLEDLADGVSGIALVNAVKACKTERDLGEVQGELKKVEALFSFQAQVEAFYAAAQEDESDA